MSFTKDTRILLSNYETVSYYELIKDASKNRIRTISYNRKIDNIEFSSVLFPRRLEVEPRIIQIQIDEQEIVHCSLGQVFYLKNKNLIKASDLKPGMHLLGLNELLGKHRDLQVTGVTVKQNNSRMCTSTIVQHSNYALACGVFARA